MRLIYCLPIVMAFACSKPESRSKPQAAEAPANSESNAGAGADTGTGAESDAGADTSSNPNPDAASGANAERKIFLKRADLSVLINGAKSDAFDFMLKGTRADGSVSQAAPFLAGTNEEAKTSVTYNCDPGDFVLYVLKPVTAEQLAGGEAAYNPAASSILVKQKLECPEPGEVSLEDMTVEVTIANGITQTHVEFDSRPISASSSSSSSTSTSSSAP